MAFSCGLLLCLTITCSLLIISVQSRTVSQNGHNSEPVDNGLSLTELHSCEVTKDCPWEFYCNQTECKPKADLGYSCGALDGCNEGLRCVNGTCVRKSRRGATCETNVDCSIGLTCGNGTCTRRAKYSGDCSSDNECLESLFCFNRRCMRNATFGNQCSWTAECLKLVKDSVCGAPVKKAKRKRCQCRPGFRFDKMKMACIKEPSKRNRNLMIVGILFAATAFVMIITCVVIFQVRRLRRLEDSGKTINSRTSNVSSIEEDTRRESVFGSLITRWRKISSNTAPSIDGLLVLPSYEDATKDEIYVKADITITEEEEPEEEEDGDEQKEKMSKEAAVN